MLSRDPTHTEDPLEMQNETDLLSQYLDASQINAMRPPVSSHSDFYLEIIRPNLEGQKFKIMGFEWDPRNNQYVKVREGLANEEGANEIIIIAEFWINKETMTTNLSEKLINSKMRDLCKDLAENMVRNYVRWGVKAGNRKVLLRGIENMAENILWMSWEDGTRKHVSQAVTRSEIVNMNRQPQSRWQKTSGT